MKDLQGEAPRVPEVVDPEYTEYLTLLAERNRILKRMREKNNTQVKAEKREQGFSIYCNGANTITQTKMNRTHLEQQKIRQQDRGRSVSQCVCVYMCVCVCVFVSE